MKHRPFFLLCMALVAFLFTVVGILSLLGYPFAEVSFWTRDPIESTEGKVAWVLVSATCWVVFLTWAVRDIRSKHERTQRS